MTTRLADADPCLTRAPSERVAAWMPAGMLDWPGRVATTVFIAGCNFRCPYCHNSSLVQGSGSPEAWQTLASHIRTRRDWIDGVVITGGEPTTDPGLLGLLNEFASWSVPVKLDTNGTNPRLLSDILDSGLVAHVALDIKSSPERYSSACGVASAWPAVSESISAVIDSGIPHEFRTTAYPLVVTRDDLTSIAAILSEGNLYVLQQFRPGETLLPEASSVEPYSPDVLLDIAQACSSWIPTVTRGV
ncbi:MAG: anaerobic ribonucleoside-triphosphate reductase activating protein [Actinomycetota bacterium]|nr:anaerobic ribonucleoside-triphosphate reductase activating protein [Actinomycetota bacterium]